MSFGEASDLLLELLREPRSHLRADMRRYEYPASDAEVAGIALTQAVLNLFREKGSKAVELPFPWQHPDSNSDVTPEMRASLEARLDAVSAFPGT